jgi:hypothetical protein
MFTSTSSKRFWKVLGWIVAALLINLLMLLSLQSTGLWLDYGGIALAQTGPPDDTPTPIPTATPTHTPTSVPTPTPTNTATPIPTATTPPQAPSFGGGGGGSRSDRSSSDRRGSDTGEDQMDEPTATFTPLPFPTDLPPLVVTETVVIEATSTFTPTATTEPISGDEISTPLPPPPAIDYSLCESISTGEPPPGFPTLAGHGTIYHIIPAPSNIVVQVTTKLGNGIFNFNLAVPSSPTLCKVAEIDQDPAFILEPPAPIPESINLLVPFNIDIFGVDRDQNITKITSHVPPLVFSTDPLEVADEATVVLLRYDEVEQQYRLPQQEYDRTTKTLTAHLSQTSFFILGTLADQPTSPVPDEAGQVVPTLPPTDLQAPVTPSETKDDLLPLWLFLGILAGLLGILTLFLLLGGGRALKDMLSNDRPDLMGERDLETGGIALAFAAEMPDVDPLLRINLALLPAAVPPKTALSQSSSATKLNLPSIGATASIKATKMGMLKVQQAITVPDEVNLVGWSEAGLPSGQFSYSVQAGYLDWYGVDEIFARLSELEPGEVIKVHSQTDVHQQYFVDQAQSYQADTSSVVEIPYPTTGDQLVVIAWSEAYDVDQQEYRDYIVIQAHMADAPLVNRFGMLKADTF